MTGLATPASDAALVSLVVPFYNEGEGVDAFFDAIVPLCQSLADSFRFEFVCVDDGSRDDSLVRLERHARQDGRIVVVELSRNFGKEAALSAGLRFATGDAVIPLDADLQDPPKLIPGMLSAWQSGAEVVLARRVDRSSDGWLKRASAKQFYKLHNRMSNPPLPENVGDFRLMARNVVDALNC